MTNGNTEPSNDLENEEDTGSVVQEEPPELNEPDTTEVFLRDEEPTGEEDRSKYWLLRGLSDEEVAEKGLNPNTVRIARSHLMRDGYMKKERKPSKPKNDKPSAAVAKQTQGKQLQTFAKGSPPESLINALEVPDPTGNGALLQFESGMKFGLTMLVTAVRLVSEMSIIGSQQVKPLLDMTKTMREGEALSYKAGAEEAAFKAAQAMGQTILPEVGAIHEDVARIEKSVAAGAAGGDPVKGMMVRTMEPLLQNMMGKMIPGMAGSAKSEPAGWKRRQE